MSTILLCLRRPLHRKTSQKSLEKGFGGRTFPLHGVLNTVNMYGFSEEVILGDFLCKLSHAKLVHLSVKSEGFIRMKCEVYNYVITAGP